MTANSVFLSYSRQQLYFAESIASNLQATGLSLWFDLQQLKPGSDWEKEIGAGIAASGTLVAVISRAAIASKYVRQEWDLARQQNIPIIAVIYEAVEALPDVLSEASIIDLRSQFEEGMIRLANAIMTGESIHDAMPCANRFNIPLQAPASIWWVTVHLVFTALVAAPLGLWGWISVLQLDPSNLTQIPLFITYELFAELWLLFTIWRWIQHRTNFTSITLVPLVIALFNAVLGFSVLLFSNSSRAAFYFVFGLAHTAVIVTLMLQFPDAAIRWLPAGRVPQRLRKRLNSRTVPYSSSTIVTNSAPNNLPITQAKSVNFIIFCVAADHSIADEVRKMLTHYGHVEVQTANQSAVPIAIISTNTPIKMLQTWIDDYQQRLITIVASAIDMAPPVTLLSKYQWIDYRSRERDRLRLLAESLSFPDRELYSALSIPEFVAEVRTPNRVTLFVYQLRGVAVLGAISALATIFIHTADFGSQLLVIGLALFNVIMALVLHIRVFKRRVSVFPALLFFGILQLSAYVQSNLLTTLPAQSTFTSSTYSTYTVQGPTFASVIQFAIPTLFWIIVCFLPLRRWLGNPEQQWQPTLPDSISRRIWNMTALYSGLGVLVVAIITGITGVKIFAGRSDGYPSLFEDGRFSFGYFDFRSLPFRALAIAFVVVIVGALAEWVTHRNGAKAIILNSSHRQGNSYNWFGLHHVRGWRLLRDIGISFAVLTVVQTLTALSIQSSEPNQIGAVIFLRSFIQNSLLAVLVVALSTSSAERIDRTKYMILLVAGAMLMLVINLGVGLVKYRDLAYLVFKFCMTNLPAFFTIVFFAFCVTVDDTNASNTSKNLAQSGSKLNTLKRLQNINFRAVIRDVALVYVAYQVTLSLLSLIEFQFQSDTSELLIFQSYWFRYPNPKWGVGIGIALLLVWASRKLIAKPARGVLYLAIVICGFTVTDSIIGLVTRFGQEVNTSNFIELNGGSVMTALNNALQSTISFMPIRSTTNFNIFLVVGAITLCIGLVRMALIYLGSRRANSLKIQQR